MSVRQLHHSRSSRSDNNSSSTSNADPTKVKVTSADGSIYEGATVGGLRAGLGKLTFADGSVFEGEFSGGMRSGRGLLWSKDGSIHSCGLWRADELLASVGVPRYLLPQGTFLRGEGAGADFITPEGNMVWSPLDKSGVPLMHGTCRTVFAAGGSLGGEYRRGVLLQGRHVEPSRGLVYCGQFQDGAYHGLGQLVLAADGRVIEGSFVAGRPDRFMTWSKQGELLFCGVMSPQIGSHEATEAYVPTTCITVGQFVSEPGQSARRTCACAHWKWRSDALRAAS